MKKKEERNESIREYIGRRKKEEQEGWQEMDNQQKEEAFTAGYTLADVEIKFKESQREMLEVMIKDAENLDKAVKEKRSWGKERFYNRLETILEAYQIIFGYHNWRDITNTDELDYAGMDPEAAKKILEGLR